VRNVASNGQAAFFPESEKVREGARRAADGVAGANDIINWLKHGEVTDPATGQRKRYETATVEELDVGVTIYRGITKFEAIFENEKTPQMLSFKKWLALFEGNGGSA